MDPDEQDSQAPEDEAPSYDVELYKLLINVSDKAAALEKWRDEHLYERLNLTGAALIGAALAGANLRGAALAGADLRETSLTSTIFRNVKNAHRARFLETTRIELGPDKDVQYFDTCERRWPERWLNWEHFALRDACRCSVPPTPYSSLSPPSSMASLSTMSTLG
jgi:uncharacterized protein YjbI with pentapeptide repeats